MPSTTAPNTQNTNALNTSTMINQRELSLLEQLEAAGCGVDVDAGDPEVAKALPFKPHDMTSNQILVHERIMAPENKELVEKTIREMKGADWLDIHIKLTARFHALVIPFIQGRVLAQVSPRNANDKQKIIEHARKYRDAYNAEGVSNDRFCIKIPTTTAGVQAAAQLYEEGIRTLGTALFSLAQALAAAQAKMLSISPYFNEVRAHVEQDLWPDVEDPATQHPMAYRMIHIRDAYAKLKAQGKHVPLNKAASCITARECMAMAELGADQNTILIGPLTDLMNTTKLPVYGKGQEWQKRAKELVDHPHIQWANWDAPAPEVSAKRMAELSHADPLSKAMQKDAKLASLDEDYLADGVLDKYNQEDEVTRNRLGDAILLFHNAEEDSRKEIQRLQAAYV